MTPFSKRATGASFLILGLCLSGQVHAQVVERHLPTTPQAENAQIAVPNAVADQQDDTPIGPVVRAIVLLSPNEPVLETADNGVLVSKYTRLTLLQDQLQADIAPFLGKPLSRKLIADIEAIVALRYREAGYPFVSLSTPEQVIGDGVLQIRVTEFKAGAIAVTGAKPGTEQAILDRVAVKNGDAVNARTLNYDLAWLNRYPFRRIQAMFKPGQETGQTDLILAVDEGKPWQVYGGYSNSGSPATGTDRYFAGGMVGGVFGRDSLLSLQTTGSRDAVTGKKHPHYTSQALSYILPVGRHRQIEASVDQVETNQVSSPFSVRLKSTQGAIGYRLAVSDLYGDRGLTDMRIGIEAKHQTGTTFFGKVNVYETAINIYQLYLGYHHSEEGPRATSDLDFAFHLSPGGVDDGNNDASFRVYTQGRMKKATYGYVALTYNHKQMLGGDMSLKTQGLGQLATGALPGTEVMGLGGMYLVRGYTLDDGSFDSALILRNELRFADRHNDLGGVSPYLFLDLGHGYVAATGKGTDLASIGAGADIRLAQHVSLNFDAACAGSNGAYTRAGDVRADVSLNFTF